MNFKEIISENNNKYDVYIGFNGRKEKIKINIKDKPSTIITGETGSGKSILLDQIICQLIKNNTSLDMQFALIDTGGVELNYYLDTDYIKKYDVDIDFDKKPDEENKMVALGDIEKAQVILNRFMRELDTRQDIITKKGYLNVDEYNHENEEKLEDLVLVIDDNDSLIGKEDVNTWLKDIIKKSEELNVFVFIATSNPHNPFFKRDDNLIINNRISFDLAGTEEAALANIDDAENMHLMQFKYEDKIYNVFDFEDETIFDIINK